MLRRNILFVALGMAVAASAACGQVSSVGSDPVATGPVGPVVVDVPAGASQAVTDAAVHAALKGMPHGRSADATYDFLVRRKLLRPGQSLSFTRPVVVRENGRLRLPDLERMQRTRGRLGGGELTFVYDGWSQTDAQNLQAFVQQMYPIAKQVYGAPSATTTVHIVRDTSLTDAAMHLRNGIYNLSNNEIRFNPTGNLADDMYTLTHLILYAFHGNALFAYDSWEEGFTWAATYVIYKQINPSYDLGQAYSSFYFLQLYELLNQPGIGNLRFWPASFDQIVATERAAVLPYSLFMFRSAMAGAAWAKVYVENPGFFRDFNAAYYQQYSPSLAGNTPALKAIAASVVPTVEGLPFQDWYRRQYILDTATSAGPQLWAWALPQFDDPSGNPTHLVLLLFYFTRDSAGNETPQGGTANLNYLSWDFVQDYFAEEGNSTAIPSATDQAGVGSISPGLANVGGAQKINVRISVNGLTRLVLWPYLVRGQESNPNDFFGVTLDADTGEVGAIVGSGQEAKTALSQAAFGMKAGVGSGWNKVLTRVTDANGKTVNRQVNTGYDFYAAVLQGPRPDAATYTQSFPAGRYLMSVPAYPTVADPDALGVAAAKLLLAHWDPTLVTGSSNYHYRVYPGTPPLQPGLGYWLQLSQDTNVSFPGNAPAQDQSQLIPLRAGWNQIGNPFLKDVPVSSLRVLVDSTDPADAIDLATAASRGLLSGTFWGYTQANGFAPADSLQTWHGYFVQAQQELLLLVPAVASPGGSPADSLAQGNPILGEGQGRSRSRSRAPALNRTVSFAPPAFNPTLPDGWRMRMIARAGTLAGTLIVGASRSASDGFDGAFDAQQPPDMGDYVHLGTSHPEWGRAAGTYALDIRSAATVRQSWDITLDTSLHNQDVQLSWPDVSRLPKDVRLYLSDLDGGRRWYLRTTGGVVVNSGDTGTRHLRLEATRGEAPLLAITNVVVNPTRARGGTGLDVQFSVTADVSVDAQILSTTGRTLRRVTRAQAIPAGTGHILWDGRSDAGAQLGAGIYLLQLTASTPEGQSIQVTRPLVMVR